MGDSHVRRAAVVARQDGDFNLGLGAVGITIWWKGKSGAHLQDLESMLISELSSSAPPDILIVHLGSNDFGNGGPNYMFALFTDAFRRLFPYCPQPG